MSEDRSLIQSVGGPGRISVDGWRLYYGDNTILDSITNAWKDVPSNNVQVMLVFYVETYGIFEGDPPQLKNYPYRDVLISDDYYWQYGSGTAAQASAAGATDLKRGRAIPDDKWWSVYNQAHSDLYLR